VVNGRQYVYKFCHMLTTIMRYYNVGFPLLWQYSISNFYTHGNIKKHLEFKLLAKRSNKQCRSIHHLLAKDLLPIPADRLFCIYSRLPLLLNVSATKKKQNK